MSDDDDFCWELHSPSAGEPGYRKPVTEWQPIETAPEGVEVMTKVDDERGERNVQSLVKRTRIPGETVPMFWLPDGSMYVYYAPTHWRQA